MLIAEAWLAPGDAPQRRWLGTMRGVLIFLLGTAILTRMNTSYDVTEDRRHSFSEADEAVLRTLPAPLKIEIHLGADDPRLTDLRHEILDRLERVVPHLSVSYEGSAGTGRLGNADPQYGEIWYEMSGKRTMLKSAIEPIVLQTIYDLAGVKATPVADAESYPGYPLDTSAPFAWFVFFAIWPAIVLTLFWRARMA